MQLKLKKQTKDYKCIIDLFENDKKCYQETISKLRNKIKEFENEQNNNLNNMGKNFFKKYPDWS